MKEYIVRKNFVLRFVRTDNKPNEDYYYATKEEAEEHYSLFQDDDSGLYSSIEIIEEDL